MENWFCKFEFEDVAWLESLYEVKCRAIQAAYADRLHSNHLMSSSPSKFQKHSTHSTQSTHSRVLDIAAFAACLRRGPGVPLATTTSCGARTPGVTNGERVPKSTRVCRAHSAGGGAEGIMSDLHFTFIFVCRVMIPRWVSVVKFVYLEY